ncbi:hypothetical protein BDV95DRAFT_670796 [Massariosphaeria phaeospora]|uniref:Uncharacterized protein n=1 Tax=Massariosphaeria phaeospora TaxID=100035 RepID=A0A7C8I5N6_9PLEO|nr:hypothetical protein BDV95DRAFT_670796 [Massariosphaeria phaeospora]
MAPTQFQIPFRPFEFDREPTTTYDLLCVVFALTIVNVLAQSIFMVAMLLYHHLVDGDEEESVDLEAAICEVDPNLSALTIDTLDEIVVVGLPKLLRTSEDNEARSVGTFSPILKL